MQYMGRIFFVIMNRIDFALYVGTGEKYRRYYRAGCCMLAWWRWCTMTLTGQRCRRRCSLRRLAGLVFTLSREPSPRAWWWHKRSDRAKDVNTRGDFLVFRKTTNKPDLEVLSPRANLRYAAQARARCFRLAREITAAGGVALRK